MSGLVRRPGTSKRPIVAACDRRHRLRPTIGRPQQHRKAPTLEFFSNLLVQHRLVVDVDAALEQEVLDLAQRQRVARVHNHSQADHFRRAVEIAERIFQPPPLRDAAPSPNRNCSDNAKSSAQGNSSCGQPLRPDLRVCRCSMPGVFAYCEIVSWRLDAILTKSAKECASIFRITLPRWAFTVISLMPSLCPTCLLSNPVATNAMTPRSRLLSDS